MKLTTHIRNLIFLWRQRDKTGIPKGADAELLLKLAKNNYKRKNSWVRNQVVLLIRKIREEKIKKEKIIPIDTEEEQWVDLFMDNNYLVSNLGRLFSKKTDKYLTWSKEPRIKGNKNISLHKEVYKSFNGDYDKDSYTLIFLDGNTRNRRLDNLYLSYITDNGYNWVMRVRQNLSSNKKGGV